MAYSEEESSNELVSDIGTKAVDTLLIPGLPDDLAMLCLVRLPRRCHHIVQGVCCRWRSFFRSQLFVALRKRLGLLEGWVYVLSRDMSACLHWHVLDPAQRRWMALPGMPPVCSRRFGMACEVLDGKLYLIGGCDKVEDATDEVYVFDPLQYRWEKISHMGSARSHFVSGVLCGRVYAIGGTGSSCGALTSWETYDPCTNEWTSYDDPTIFPDLGESLVMDGIIYVRHISPTNGLSLYTAAYDPVKNLWTMLDDEMTRRWNGPAVVMGDNTYMLDQTYGIKLLALDKANRCWSPVGRISPFAIRTPCRMAVVGTTLFVVGRGLKALALDMEKTGKVAGFLVMSSVMGLQCSDDVIVSCNTIYV